MRRSRPPSYPPGFSKRTWRRDGRDGWSYVTRVQRGGSDRLLFHGQDFEVALKKHRELSVGDLPPRLSLDAAHEHWRERYVLVRRNEKGQRDTLTRYVNHVAPLLGHTRLDRLTGEHIRELSVKLKDKLEPQTISHVLADLRCFLTWAVDAGLLDRTPFPRRIMPRIEERLPDRLTESQIEAVVGIAEPHGFVVRLALGSGLRWAELCRAQRAHLDGDTLLVERTKSGRVRRVPVADPVLLHEVRQHVGRLVPFSVNSAGVFNRAVRHRSGLARFHVHQCRHTFACTYLERGGSLVALQQILGHASIETTQRYARLGDAFVLEDARRVAARARQQ